MLNSARSQFSRCVTATFLAMGVSAAPMPKAVLGSGVYDPNGSSFCTPQAFGCPVQDEFYLCNTTKMVAEPPPRSLGGKPSCLQFVTLDFDGTLECCNKLAHDVIGNATVVERTTDLITAYKKVMKQGGGMKKFIEDYFISEAHVAGVAEYLAKLRAATSGHVYILSASWSPVPALVWRAYLHALTEDLKWGFDEAHIIGIDDPGPGIAAQKGVAFQALMEATVLGNSTPSDSGALNGFAHGVHCDDSWKYNVQVLHLGGNGFHAAPLRLADFGYMLGETCAMRGAE